MATEHGDKDNFETERLISYPRRQVNTESLQGGSAIPTMQRATLSGKSSGGQEETMGKSNQTGRMTALNGQTVPQMQRVSSAGVNSTRGATVPKMQPVGQGYGTAGGQSGSNSGGKK